MPLISGLLTFKSMIGRVVFLHVVVVAVVAIFLPLLLFWLLNSEINRLHSDAMRAQADAVSQRIVMRPEGTLALDLPDDLKGLYSEAYGRYQFEIRDAGGLLLFSSKLGAAPVNPIQTISGAMVSRSIGGRVIHIMVSEDLAHRDVITDDIIANFFQRVGWIILPILLALIAIDIIIFRRAIAPLIHASREVTHIGPARTDIRLPTTDIPLEIRPLVIAVNQALDRLDDGFRVQRQFTADAAHQLRTPLAILHMRVAVLDNGDVKLALLADIERMSRIVVQLLEIAELDSLVLDPSETADLQAVSAEVVETIAPFALAQRKSIALKSCGKPVIIRGNSEMLKRAIFNLAENAIKFTAPETTVSVDVHDDGSVAIRDDGPGIAPGENQLIFERFWRADHARSDGAGLGLSIVQGVAKDHDAIVSVENLPGHGAQFTIRFRLGNRTDVATA